MITNLKRLSIVLALVFISINAKAQLTIKAGLTSADISLSDNSGALDQLNKAKKGLHFGIFRDKKMNDLLSFETGLMFDQKGMKRITEVGSVTTTDIMNIAYLQLPVALKIGLDVNDDVRIFGKLGGYGAYGLSGKLDTEVVTSGVVSSTTASDLNIGTDVAAGDQVKPIDFGGEVGVGIQYKSFSFEMDLGMGLANIATDTSSGEDFKNKEFKFTLGYSFGK
ncbi:MAG: porin family protein [Flavobacteriaceae bacterium]